MSQSKESRKCAKCGSRIRDNILFRFPSPRVTNLLRCALWAKFLYPSDETYYSVAFLRKIHSGHTMLCQKHFAENDFTDCTKKRLVRNAVPHDEVETEKCLENQQDGQIKPTPRELPPTLDYISFLEYRKNEQKSIGETESGSHNLESGTHPKQTSEKGFVSGTAPVDLVSQMVVDDSRTRQESRIAQDSQLYVPDFHKDRQELERDELDLLENLQETQVDLQEFQVEVEESQHNNSDYDELPLALDDCEVETAEWGQMKLNLTDEEPDQGVTRGPKTRLSEALVAERKEVSERVQCSRCSACIQRQATLFRCVECADAALCSDCASRTHASHCVMRMPSTRVYRVLEDVFQQLRLDVRTRLYPDKDMLQLDHDTSSGGTRSHEAKTPVTQESVSDEDWMDEAVWGTDGGYTKEASPQAQECEPDEVWLDLNEALQSDSEEQPAGDCELRLQHYPLIEVKEEDSEEEPAASDSTHDPVADTQKVALDTSRLRAHKAHATRQDPCQSARKKLRKDIHQERSEETIEVEKRSRTPVSKSSTELKKRTKLKPKRLTQTHEHSHEYHKELKKKPIESMKTRPQWPIILINKLEPPDLASKEAKQFLATVRRS